MSRWIRRRLTPALVLTVGLALAAPPRVLAAPATVPSWLTDLLALWGEGEQGGCIDPDGHVCTRRGTLLHVGPVLPSPDPQARRKTPRAPTAEAEPSRRSRPRA